MPKGMTPYGRTQPFTTRSLDSRTRHRRSGKRNTNGQGTEQSVSSVQPLIVCRRAPMYRSAFASPEPELPHSHVILRCDQRLSSLDLRPPLNPLARHDAPAAPARFVGRKLRAGREGQLSSRAAFATYKPGLKITRNFSARRARQIRRRGAFLVSNIHTLQQPQTATEAAQTYLRAWT